MAMVRVPTDRMPTHPGEILLEEFLTPLNLTQRELATALSVPYQRINEIVNGRRGITPGTALRLARFFGTSADFWLNLQLRWDLYHARREEAAALENIEPYTPLPMVEGPGARYGQAAASVAEARPPYDTHNNE